MDTEDQIFIAAASAAVFSLLALVYTAQNNTALKYVLEDLEKLKGPQNG